MKISPTDVAREVVVTVLGAIGAAFVIGQLPGLRDWIQRQWKGAK